eukprot:TRINITY_DN7924_c0_g1_i2.p1 TRINITY_DN7924_c0_g1~~TRINITY_DN7924_c0_g1_i2.p1  ORF type:complete len:924 (+),score=194.72 TRINITY_DN7924_c0_g1_i2:3-2774(+)
MQSFSAPILTKYLREEEGPITKDSVTLNGPVTLVQVERPLGFDVNDLEAVVASLPQLYSKKDSEAWRKVIEATSSNGLLKDVVNSYPYLLHQTVELAPLSISSLLDLGIDVNAHNERQETALYIATARSPLETIQALIDAGADVNSECSNRQATPLMQAISRTDLDVFHLLLERGACMNMRNTQGLSPVDVSIFKISKNPEFVEKIWSHFPEEHVKQLKLKRVLSYVTDFIGLNLAFKIFGEEAVLSITQAEGEAALLEAIKKGSNSVDLVMWYTKNFGLDLEKLLYPAGNSVLHVAAQRGSTDLVAWIVDNFPSLLMKKNSQGETPLALAMKQGGLLNPTTSLLAKHENNLTGTTSVKMEKTRKQLRKESVKSKTNIAEKRQDLCTYIATDKDCPYGVSCKQSHDVSLYLASRNLDKLKEGDEIVNVGSGRCMFFDQNGACPYGLKCIFAAQHMEGNRNITKQVPEENFIKKETNFLKKKLQRKLRKKTFKFTAGSRNEEGEEEEEEGQKVDQTEENKDVEENEEEDEDEENEKSEEKGETGEEKKRGGKEKMTSVVEDERKPIDWSGKLVLAPLTTVGNLPFRRLCVGLGADVTISEMAMAGNIVRGFAGEWALVRRHPSESIFGVQVCGNNSETLSRCAQLLSLPENNIDFIDINVGCPIDFICNQGMGSSLLGHLKKLQGLVEATSRSSNGVPVTVKMRMGVDDKRPIVLEKVAPVIKEWGASAITLHGRSKAARYRNQANWDYVDQVGEICRSRGLPLIGNGDIFNPEEANFHLRNRKVDALMIARGALIKPWIFQEIKEDRNIDISASERFDLMKKYVDFGLEHWGSDIKGVENTRYFFLNWYSFLHRYVPLGIMERVPIKIYENAPRNGFYGRNDLETLMGSPQIKDWLKISEMLLGPISDPERFADFSAKHQAKG